jgi:hypothetical protein
MRARFITKCAMCRKKIMIGQEIDLAYGRAVHISCGGKLRRHAYRLGAKDKTTPSRIELFDARIQAALDKYERAGFR